MKINSVSRSEFQFIFVRIMQLHLELNFISQSAYFHFETSPPLADC